MGSEWMKAILYDKANKPDKLVMCEVKKPAYLDNEVLVRIAAASINAADYRSMELGIIPKRKIFGADIAGHVEACGINITKFKVGDRVFGDLSGSGFGGFAEYATAPETVLALKPERVSFQEAAALPVAALTALQGLRDLGNVQAGQKVLIYGAGGGVGHYAVQIARHFCAEVTAACSTKNCAMMQELGVDQVIDYAQEDVFGSKERYDLILAVNGNHALFKFSRYLSSNGIFVMVGGGYTQIILALASTKLMSLGSKKFKFLAGHPNSNDLEFLIRLVEEEKIRPIIDRYYELAETAEAVNYLHQRHTAGKVIINICQN